MLLKTIITLFLIVQTAQAIGLDSKPIYKENPKLQNELDKYWQAFLLAKTADSNPGKMMAAQIRLAEIEEELEVKGFSEQAFDELRTQAQDAFVEIQQKREVRVSAETFDYVVDQLDKLTPQTMDHFSNVLKDYGLENESRRQGLELFIETLNEQFLHISTRTHSAFFKLAISYYLLAESQNFIGNKEAAKKLNKVSSLALLEYLRVSDSYSKTSQERLVYILRPIEAIYAASGVPDLTETASNLTEFYKTYTTEPVANGFIKNFKASLNHRNKPINLYALVGGILTTSVATYITMHIGWENIHKNLFVLPIWGLALKIFLLDANIFSMQPKIQAFRKFLAEDRSVERLRATKAEVIRALEKTCKVKLQGR